MFSYANARPNETKLCDYLEETCVNWEEVAKSLLGYLSDDDVKDWAESEGYDIFDEEEDDEGIELPDEAIVELSELDCSLNDEEEIKDAVIDFLTDELGFCIKGCNISLEDEGLAKVTNIEWDTED